MFIGEWTYSHDMQTRFKMKSQTSATYVSNNSVKQCTLGMPLIPVLCRLRQEDHHGCEPAWVTQ